MKAGTAAAAAVVAEHRVLAAATPRIIATPSVTSPRTSPSRRWTGARDAGAQYADARVGNYRRQSLNTREHQITGVAHA